MTTIQPTATTIFIMTYLFSVWLPSKSIDKIVLGLLIRNSTYQWGKPSIGDPVLEVFPADDVPDAGEPVSHDHVEAEHQQQQREAALQKPVQGSSHSAQSKKPHHLEAFIKIVVEMFFLAFFF